MTHSKNKRAIFIDFDGTLVNSVSCLDIALTAFLEKYHVHIDCEDKKLFNGPPIIEIIGAVRLKYKIADSLQHMEMKYFDMVKDLYNQLLPNPWARELLLETTKKEYAVIIVTSNIKTIVTPWLMNNKLNNFVDAIVDCKDVSQGKPSPEPYNKAIAVSLCKINNCIAVEDSYLGALSAVRAELKTYCIRSSRVEENITHSNLGGVVIIDSLCEIMSIL